MKLTILSEKLLEKINFSNHAISTKTQLPILNNLFLKATKGMLYISSTDLEIGIRVGVPASVEEEGETTVPAKTFTELINTIKQGKIKLSVKKEGLELIGEKINTIFQTTPPEEFPKLYEEEGQKTPFLNKNTIEKELSKIVFAANQDTTRPALSGVLLRNSRETGETQIVATDGYRLSLKKIKQTKSQTEEEVSMIIPSRMIKELLFMSKFPDEIKTHISKEKNQIIFVQGDTILVGRLIEAEFPSFEKIIPEDFSTKTNFDKTEMENAVKACYIFAKNSASIIKISVKKDKIIVIASTPSVGENTVDVGAKTLGEENEIAFNARYLLDLFSHIEDEEMVFEMTGPLNPGVFKTTKDDSFLHLIMPIRVQQEG